MMHSWLPLLLSLAFTVGVLGCQSSATEQTPQDLQAQAEELAHNAIIVDGHIDVPYRLLDFEENIADSTIGGDFDYPRAKAGGLNAPFMSIYIPVRFQDTPGASKAHADTLIDMVEGFAEEHPDKFAIATSPEDVRQQFKQDVISLPMGMENGSGLEGDVSNVQYFYDRGIRYITLTHAEDNKIGDSSYDDSEDTWNGLSPFGEKIVAEMNRLGIMVDISHVTDSTAYDVLKITEAPVVATHSAARHFTPDWERNMSDDLIQTLADNGGVIMISFGSSFLRNEYQDQDDPIRERMQAHIDSMGWADDSREAIAYTEKTRKANPIGSVEDVADHIDYVVNLVGVDHVGLGSDFDGVFALPEGLQDVSGYPNLIAELLERGYTKAEIRKILGENLLRVWTEVERTAQNLQAG